MYWVVFPIEDLRQAVKTARRILTKEKINRQLAVQSSSTPFVNIWDGYNSGKEIVSFDTKDRLDDKLDKITSVITKLIAQGSSQNRPLKPKNYQGKAEDKLEIIVIKIDIKVGIDKTAVIGECDIEVEVSRDKITDEGHNMSKIIEGILGKDILEEHRIIEVRILGVDVEVILGMIILEEVEVGLEKDSIQVTLEEMIKASVDWDQVQEQVLIEIESDALSIGSMIILPKTVWIYQIQKRNSKIRYRKCLI